MRLAAFAILFATFATGVVGQTAPRTPVIDMHVHSTNTTPEQELKRMEQFNIRYIVVSTLKDDFAKWAGALKPSQFAPGLVFPCNHGHAPYFGQPCFGTDTEFPDIDWLRSELREGRIRAFAELEPQYVGRSPADPRMEPFWQLAEEFDLPVGIHMGPAPPAIADQSSPRWPPVKSPQYRMGLGDALLLEEVLVKHPRLRLYVMHAGWPKLESMIALMAEYPNVYVDVAGLQSQSVTSRPAYYRHLQGLVEAGFAKRIMFGSDFPDEVGGGIDAIKAADFLSTEQKADILCNNAARFLRLNPSPCGS